MDVLRKSKQATVVHAYLTQLGFRPAFTADFRVRVTVEGVEFVVETLSEARALVTR